MPLAARSAASPPEMAFLTRTDPARNIDRLYVVEIMPTLFGEFALLREWGRRGSAGTVRLTSYERREAAEAAERRTIKRRLQHGYALRGGPALRVTEVACSSSWRMRRPVRFSICWLRRSRRTNFRSRRACRYCAPAPSSERWDRRHRRPRGRSPKEPVRDRPLLRNCHHRRGRRAAA
jgi:predicted DNA-binding WGR domain protein